MAQTLVCGSRHKAFGLSDPSTVQTKVCATTIHWRGRRRPANPESYHTKELTHATL